MKHPVTIHEDSLCSVWIEKLYPKALSIDGCEKIFHWSVMDEFEGGYSPETFYGSHVDSLKVKKVALWGLIGGDMKWRRSAYAFKKLFGDRPK